MKVCDTLLNTAGVNVTAIPCPHSTLQPRVPAALASALPTGCRGGNLIRSSGSFFKSAILKMWDAPVAGGAQETWGKVVQN